MKSILALALIVCLASAQLDASASNCGAISVNESAVYNILPFSKQQVFSMNFTAPDDHLYTVNMSFCSPIVNNCENGEGPVYAIYYDALNQSKYCLNLATALPNYELLNAENPEDGFYLSYGVVTDSKNNELQLNVTFICNETATQVENVELFNIESLNNGNVSTINAYGQSYYGCPYFTINQFMKFLNNYKALFVVVAVLLGFFVTFYGLKMFNIAIFCIATITTTFICGELFYEFVKFNATSTTLWVVFFVCLVIGLIMGYLAIAFEKAGFFALGAALGVIVGMILYQGILATFLAGHGSAIFYVFCGLLGLIGGLLSFWIYKDIIIIATSVVGSFIIVRGISVYTGNFPSEIDVANGVQGFSAYTYAYLAVIAIMSIAGIWVQFKNKKEQDDIENQDNNQNIYKNMMGDTGY